MKEKIKFNQLSWNCKVGIIAGWVYFILAFLAFLFGFMIGYMGV